MDVARLRALWEYAVPGNTVSKSELVTVCSMYLGDASKDDAAMHSAVESVLAIATTSKQVLDLLISGENAVTTLLKASTANAPGKTASSSLRTILDQDLAEDEDDSSVDEGEGQEKAQKPAVQLLMRGFLKLKDGKLEWSGNWAMSAEAFASGDRAKFRYEMREKAENLEKEGKIMAMPKSAVFDGSFLVKDANAPNGHARVDESNIKLAFTPQEKPNNWKVSGGGMNSLGEFTVDGELDGESRRMAVYKAYVRGNEDSSSADSNSEGEIEEEEIDPTELADLQADQRETFGRVLAGPGIEDGSSKVKKRRIVEG